MNRIEALIAAIGRGASQVITRIAPSPRERALLALFVAALTIAGAIEAGAFALSSRARALDARAALASAAAATQRSRDPAHRAALETGAVQARAWSFDDPTAEIAAVRSQTDLDAMARASGLTDVRVIVAPGGRGNGPLRLTVESSFSWDGVDAFMSALAQSAQSYSVEAIEVDEEAATLRLDVRAPYLKPGAAS